MNRIEIYTLLSQYKEALIEQTRTEMEVEQLHQKIHLELAGKYPLTPAERNT